MGFVNVLRAGDGKKVRALAALVPDINSLEGGIKGLSDSELREKTAEFKNRLSNGETTDDILLEAFAVVREAASRVLKQRHYDVQLMGGAALHFGWVAEMRTGEGKTLVSTLPVYLNALLGKGVHVVTANDYLASRDVETMGKLYKFLGLEVGLLTPTDVDPASRRERYLCDITYGTNKEFGFDYLRDNMVKTLSEKVQREHFFALVDEVDSILIDEARTPLVISGVTNEGASLYYRFAAVVRALTKDVHYDVDEQKRQVAPTEEGVKLVEKILGVENLYGSTAGDLVHHFQAALRAKELFLRDRDYIVDGGSVQIVDEFTGRTMEGRRWSDGLHQAVEAKESVRIQPETHTLASVTLQNYFRMYKKLAGMTGTAQTEAAELYGTYGTHVVSIPTHRRVVRVDHKDVVFKDEDTKFNAVVDDIVACHKAGQPVLVGTVSVEKSFKLSYLLEKAGVPHEVLNAKQHRKEAEIIAQAGRLGAVTVATNMAGRGVDILLGGNPDMLAVGELKKELSDPTSRITQEVLSLRAKKIEHEVKNGAESESGDNLLIDEQAEERLTARYQELFAKYEKICELEGEKVRSLGGLYVLGTERHDSRRIDNQLRGRAGRQGDPGQTRFYLSLEDQLMRVFANTKTVNWAFSTATADNVPLESKAVTKMIERAQSTIEAINVETRKNVVKYDDVLNKQRGVIYEMRDQILNGKNLKDAVISTIAEAVDEGISVFCVPENVPEDWDAHALHSTVYEMWPTVFTEEEMSSVKNHDELYELLVGEAIALYEKKEAELSEDKLRELEQEVMLEVLDRNWLEHLSALDYLREGIGYRAAGQKDPLYEWKVETYEMFEETMKVTKRELVGKVLHGATN